MEKKKVGFLGWVEKVGNKLPHPGTIFLILCGILAVVSALLAANGVSVTYTGFDRTTNQIVEMTAPVKSLLNAEGIQYMLTSAVKNFGGFAPLAVVLVAMMGVGIAEGSGLIGVSLSKLVQSTPPKLITIVVVFAGVMSSIASDAGYVVLVPLGAVIFLSFGRHPMAGLTAAFAGVSGGFSANLLAGPVDALLSSVSTEAAHIIDPTVFVGMTDNWYFIAASAVILTIVGTLVTEKIVEPRLGEYKGKAVEKIEKITRDQKKGLEYSAIAIVIYLIIIGVMVIPQDGVLRGENGAILTSPFMSSIEIIISLFFAVAGIAYGVGSKTIKSDKDVMSLMSKTMETMGSYIVLVFFAAQFVSWFSYTNVGTVIAVNGANFLTSIGLTGVWLIIGFIFITAFINLFMGSASAKWAIMAPVFIPMLMQLGYHPALIQMAYRIGDSSTNIISPLMSYFALIVAFSQNYDEESGIGTLMSTMMPYSICFLITWAIVLVAWFYLGLPLGPGVLIK